MTLPFGRRRAGVAEAPVVAHAPVPGSVQKPPIHGWSKVLGAVALAAIGVGAAIAYRVETGGSGDLDVNNGWIKTAAVTGLAAVVGAVQWVMTNRARRRLFTEAQPVRRVEVHRSWDVVEVRTPGGSGDALAIPAEAQPEDEVRAGSLYGDPVAGGWCAVEVDGTVVVPTAPAKVRPWLGPGSPGWEKMRAEMTATYRERAQLLEQHLEAMRRVRGTLPPEQAGEIAEQIRGVELELSDLRSLIGDADDEPRVA